MAFHTTFSVEFGIAIQVGAPWLMLCGVGVFLLSAIMLVVRDFPVDGLAPLVAVRTNLASGASFEGCFFRRPGAKRAHWQAVDGFPIYFRHGTGMMDVSFQRTGSEWGIK